MRPLFILLGVWHGLISLGAALYGLWALGLAMFSPWGSPAGWLGAIFVVCGLITLPALGLVAQGGEGKAARGAGAALALPFLAMLLWILDWGFLHPGAWFYALLFLPGAILGAYAMTAKEAWPGSGGDRRLI